MKAYQYDTEGYLIKEVECQLDPRVSAAAGKDVYLLPSNSTYLEPLQDKAGFKVKFTGQSWEYEEIPAIPEPSPEDIKQREIAELKQKLAASDYAIIKIAEGAASREEYADLIAQRAEWRTRINELEV